MPIKISFDRIPASDNNIDLITITTPPTTPPLPILFLSDSCATFRKKFLRPKFGLDAAISFVPDSDDEHSIKCYILCNTAHAEREKINKKEYLEKFKAKISEITNWYRKYLTMICADKNSSPLENEQTKEWAERLNFLAKEYVLILRKQKENQ